MLTFLRSIPLIALLAALGGGYHWVQINNKDNTISAQTTTIADLRQRMSAYQLADLTQKDTIAMLESNVKQQKEDMQKIASQSQEVRSERDAYLSIFRRHDLTKLAIAKPGLIEPRINSGTQDIFKQLEEDTTQREK